MRNHVWLHRNLFPVKIIGKWRQCSPFLYNKQGSVKLHQLSPECRPLRQYDYTRTRYKLWCNNHRKPGYFWRACKSWGIWKFQEMIQERMYHLTWWQSRRNIFHGKSRQRAITQSRRRSVRTVTVSKFWLAKTELHGMIPGLLQGNRFAGKNGRGRCYQKESGCYKWCNSPWGAPDQGMGQRLTSCYYNVVGMQQMSMSVVVKGYRGKEHTGYLLKLSGNMPAGRNWNSYFFEGNQKNFHLRVFLKKSLVRIQQS